MPQIFLFDLDGTLTDPKEGITKSFAYALNSFGIPTPSLDEYAKYIGPPLRESFAEQVPKEQVEAAVAKYREYFSVNGLYENKLYDGIIDLLSRLKSEGIILAVATSKATYFAEKIATHFGFREYFDFISGCEMDGTRSLKSEVINNALNTLDPQRKITAVMIGDRKYDIIGAKQMGIKSIGVTWGYGSRDELSEAGATWIVDSPADIIKFI